MAVMSPIGSWVFKGREKLRFLVLEHVNPYEGLKRFNTYRAVLPVNEPLYSRIDSLSSWK